MILFGAYLHCKAFMGEMRLDKDHGRMLACAHDTLIDVKYIVSHSRERELRFSQTTRFQHDLSHIT